MIASTVKDSKGMLPGEWRAYWSGTKPDRVQALFRYRYGYLPDRVVRAGPILLAGPIRCPRRAQDAPVKRRT